MTGPRDWDKELANIDKVIAEGGGTPAALPVKAGAPVPRTPSPSPGVASVPVSRGRDLAAVWFKTLLGAIGAAALAYWPYSKSCGMSLYLYLGAVAVVTLAGGWAARAAWTHRRGFAHILALMVILGGLALALIEILPRTGYARVSHTWTCS